VLVTRQQVRHVNQVARRAESDDDHRAVLPEHVDFHKTRRDKEDLVDWVALEIQHLTVGELLSPGGADDHGTVCWRDAGKQGWMRYQAVGGLDSQRINTVRPSAGTFVLWQHVMLTFSRQ